MEHILIVTKLHVEKSDPPTRHFIIESSDKNITTINNVAMEGTVIGVTKTLKEAIRFVKDKVNTK